MGVLDLERVGPVSALRFGGFRIALGTYLTARFAGLIPYAAELFSREGVLPDPRLNLTYGLWPNPLYLWDSPDAARGFTAGLALVAVLFAIGLYRRAAALVLAFGSACLYNRNNLIDNPSIAFIGALLLLCACVPPGEALSFARRGDRERWFFPAWAFRAAWILMAVGYSFSGLDKLLTCPSWRDGSALTHVLELPLARPGALRDLFLASPDLARRSATWLAVGLEAAFLPLCLHPRTRRLAWLAAVGMHLGVLVLISFAELTVGMLLVHAFTYEGRKLFYSFSRSSVTVISGAGFPAPTAVLCDSKPLA